MKRIAHVIDELSVGGAQTHLVTMLRYLRAAHPFEHHVISLFGDGPLGDSLRELGFTVTALDMRPLLARQRFGSAVAEIKSLFEQTQPDLVEAHLTWSRLLGLLAARLAGIHARIGFEQGDLYLSSFKFRLANYLSQIYTDRYIVCSDALRQWVRRTHHIRDKKISVFHNCVDPDRFHPQVTPAADVIELRQKESTLFVMVGTLGTGVNKRVDIGIQAIATARQQGANVSLVIAGDGTQRRSLEDQAADLGVANYVHFLGTRSDIPNVLAASDALCHAAPFEPFGIVAIEAMAVGLPVIVPNSGGIHEAVDHESTGFVYPALHVEGLADAMSLLSGDETRRKEMGMSARRAVEDRFTVERYVRNLYTSYGFLS